MNEVIALRKIVMPNKSRELTAKNLRLLFCESQWTAVETNCH